MTELSGGSTAAVPEASPPVATVETTPQPLEPAPTLDPASAPASNTPVLSTTDAPSNTVDTEKTEASIAPAAPAPAATAPAVSNACTGSIAPVEPSSATPPVVSKGSTPPVPPVAPVSASASAPAATAAPEPAPAPSFNVKTEPTNDSFAAASTVLGAGLLESLQNAIKRPRADEGDDGNQGSEAKRAKVEVPPEAEATPVAVAAPSAAPPAMDLEAMLKSALGSMNTTLSPTPAPSAPAASVSLTPVAPTPPPLPNPAVPATPVTPAVPATVPIPAAPNPALPVPSAPISLTTTPATSTPSLPASSTAIKSPPRPPAAAPIVSTPAASKTPGLSAPTKDVASSRRDIASPGGESRFGANHMGAPSRESAKMRFAQNPTYISRSMGLPLLGSYAVQLLYALSENPGLDPTHDGEATETRRVYKLLWSAFRNTRKLFSETAAILSTEDLDIKEAGDQETILMANMATISASIFEADDIPLIEAHDYFLSTFLPEADALNKDLATLFLSLKYRTLAAELVRLPNEEQRSEFLERLFPVNLEEQLQNMHVDSPLTEYEREFMKDMMVAKERLLESAKTDESRQQLQEQYTLDGFRDELSAYLRANEDVVLRYADSHGIEFPSDDDGNGDGSDIAGDDVDSSVLNGKDFTAMGDSIASMLSAAMASSDGLTAAPSAATQQSAAPAAASGAGPMVIDSSNGMNAQPALEASPMAEGVSRLIQEAVRRSAARSTSQTPAAPPLASTPAALSTIPSVRAHTVAPPSNGPTAPAPASADGAMDLTGLTKLIKEKLGQDAQNAQPQPAPAPALVPTPAYNVQQTQSPVAQANAALSSMQNTFANNLAMYNRTPSFPFQTVPTPPLPPPQPPVSNINGNGSSGSLPPNQSSPSSILYQQARQAAASKTQGHTRREGLHSTRRPWSPDEEQALMAGLDMVKGPHWSQILQLFGANGTISDILKDRSQVQLKDKARNLKLFFLKANTEMPYYLKCVTGELKTRAPSQAARKEAEERARATNKEEQARVQGIMTLAGGLQDNKNQTPVASVPSPTPATAPATAPVPAPSHAATPVRAGSVVHNSTTNGNPAANSSARPATVAPNGATNSPARAGAPPAMQSIAPNPQTSNLPPRLASATQLSPAVQQQLQQLQQRQSQQAQLTPRQTAGTATVTAGGAGAGSAVPQRAPVTAADVVNAAARGGFPATAQALAAQQTNGSVADRPPLTPGNKHLSSLSTTSSSIKSVTADLTAGMAAAINNAINNAAIAARPTSTMLTSAQRLAAGRQVSTSPSRSPGPQHAQQHRPMQSSPSPIRNLTPQSPAVAQAARSVQATKPAGQQSPAPAHSTPSSNTTAQSITSPSTPQPQSHPSTAAPATVPVTTSAAPATTPSTVTSAAAKPLTAEPSMAPTITSGVAPATPSQATSKTTPQQPEDRLWMLQQHVHTDGLKVTPSASAVSANGASGLAVNKTSPTPAPAPNAAASAPAATNSTPVPAVASNATPATAVKAPTPISQQQLQQQNLKQEQQEDASEESVLRRLLASPPN
ncbi:hypothetical protein SPBR_04035 [Sporothrix brasiliensis 5110]|uniref:HTH myb-type domain-containing protein n=1 Tax=Sporothrix brasiliensis 5110 TaxID=1398154 RepID=A0A0C2F3P4_9PEZI|nr:uncharacterized protein SPBR_04035 [Sporothrix brasiliensis 5110]KIH93534.1 hypothetical protein SPBR_04035 [Sporothrix brasiliensis 5110]